MPAGWPTEPQAGDPGRGGTSGARGHAARPWRPPGPGWPGRAALLLGGLALAASLAAAPRDPGPGEAEDPAQRVAASDRAASPLATEVLEAIPGARYRLTLDAPSGLMPLLLRHLDLARYQHPRGPGAAGLGARLGSALAEAGGEAAPDPALDITPAELARLLAAAPAQAQALLDTEGHFAAEVEAQREADAAAGLPSLRLRIRPGPQAEVAGLALKVDGALAREAEGAGEAAEAARRRLERLRQRFGLQPGSGFSQAAWSGAKQALLNDLRSRGYPAARLVHSQAEVDAPRGRVELRLELDTGPAFRLGRVRVEGLQRIAPEAALNVQPYRDGEPYRERLLLDYQEALQRVGLFEGIAVELDPDPEQADPATVVLRLREQRLQAATLSLGYSSNTGPRLGAETSHRLPFGQPWIASARLKLSARERRLGLDLISHPRPGNIRHLASVVDDRLEAGGSVTRSQRIRVGRSRDTQRLDRAAYLEFNRSALDTGSLGRDARALGLSAMLSRQEVNNLLFPTRGWSLTLEAGGGLAADGDGDRGPYLRAYARGLYFLPLDPAAGWFAQFRGEAGQVLRTGTLGVPEILLFRAGGDDSVRGYAFQVLGPQREGATVGGAVMATASAELLRRLDGRWRDFYGAVFLDAGNVDDRWSGFRPVYGAGVGLRWRSPIGPLRADLAYGEASRSLRLHLNVGIKF